MLKCLIFFSFPSEPGQLSATERPHSSRRFSFGDIRTLRLARHLELKAARHDNRKHITLVGNTLMQRGRTF